MLLWNTTAILVLDMNSTEPNGYRLLWRTRFPCIDFSDVHIVERTCLLREVYVRVIFIFLSISWFYDKVEDLSPCAFVRFPSMDKNEFILYNSAIKISPPKKAEAEILGSF